MSKKNKTNKRLKSKKRQLKQKNDPSLHIQSLFKEAQQFHSVGKLTEAGKLYSQILEKKPEHPEALHYLGVIAYQSGQPEKAIELIKKSISYREDYPQAYNNLGNVYFDLEEFEQAERYYRQALVSNPENPSAHNNLGNALYWQNRLYEAEQSLRKALDLKPDYAEAYSNLGNTLMDQNRQEEAQECYEHALEIRPDYADASINLGVLHHDADDPETAINYFQQALDYNPRHPQALYHLGRTQLKMGNLEESKFSLQQSIQLKPSFAEAHSELGRAFSLEGHESEAMQSLKTALSINPDHTESLRQMLRMVKSAAFLDLPDEDMQHPKDILDYIRDMQPNNPQGSLRKAMVLKKLNHLDEAQIELESLVFREPDYAQAHNNLGNVYLLQSSFEQAEQSFRQAAEIQPENAEIQYNLAMCLAQQSRIEEAESFFEQMTNIKKDHLPTLKNFGRFLLNYGRLGKALHVFEKALALNEEDTEILGGMASAYHKQGRLQMAEETLHKAIAIHPDSGKYNNLGSVLKEMGRSEEAKEAYQEALTYIPNSAAIHNNIGNALMDQGLLQQAMSELDLALQLNKTMPAAMGNFLLCSNYVYTHDGRVLTQEDIFEFHRRFGDRIADTYLPQEYHFPQDQDKQRPLNIGFVSPDFRGHSVSYFLESFLETLNKDMYQICCYSDVSRPDATTQRLKSHTYIWRSIVGLPDNTVAEQIKEDQIDILIDLTGHTAQNRLMVFARKPAPIQLTWIGYPNTTGMQAMDYRITDYVADPPGPSDDMHTEKLFRLPKCFLCYRPNPQAPQVMPYLSKSWRGITFGSFNKISKYSEKTIELWSRILKALPDSKLFLKSKPFEEDETCNHYLECFADYGIEPDRITMKSWFPSLKDALAAYNEVDVALDTFPYNGTTTTCEALYMGVPSITLRGDRHAARVGASLLTAMGFEELIAENEEEYVEKAVALAQDSFRLQRYRSTTRQQMLDSALCDKERYTREVEQAFREMWQAYCDNPEEFMPQNTSNKLHVPEIRDEDLIDLGYEEQDTTMDEVTLDEDDDTWVF